jgi:transcriptional regulator with XRE-family HTH domain
MIISPAQLRGARAMLQWSSDFLAERARVHRRTLRKLERGEVIPQRATIARIVVAIAGGVDFMEDGGVRVPRSKFLRAGEAPSRNHIRGSSATQPSSPIRRRCVAGRLHGHDAIGSAA